MNDASLKRIENLCAEWRAIEKQIKDASSLLHLLDAEPYKIFVTLGNGNGCKLMVDSGDVIPLLTASIEKMETRLGEVSLALARKE